MSVQPRQAGEMADPFSESAAAILLLFSDTLGPNWLRGIMGTTFVLAVAIAIVNMFSLSTIVGRGRRRGPNQLWVWRKMYAADYDHPYAIPNGQLFSVVSGMLAAIAMAISACGFAFRPPGLVWTSNVPVLFTTFGAWMVAADAWAALWGVAFTKPTTRVSRLARHPYFVNAVCWGWPIMVLLVELGVLIWMAIRHERLRHVSTQLVDLLDQAALEFEAGGMAAVTVLGPINETEAKLSVMSVALLYAMRVTTCTSAAFAIITVLLFAVALVLVRRAYRNFIKLSKPSFSALGVNSRANTATGSWLNVSGICCCERKAVKHFPPAVRSSASTPLDRAQMALVARYRRLLLSLSIMALAVAADAATALTTAFYLTAVHLYLSPTRYSVYMGLTVLIFIPHFFPDTTLAFLSLMRVLPLWKKPEGSVARKDESAPAPGQRRNVGLFDSFDPPPARHLGESLAGLPPSQYDQEPGIPIAYRERDPSEEKEGAQTPSPTVLV